MPLASPSAVSLFGFTAEEILAEVRPTFDIAIDVIEPGTPGKLDATTGVRTGGTPDTVLIANRPARARRLTQSEAREFAGDLSAQQRYKFKTEVLPGDPDIRTGLIVRVRPGSGVIDANLPRYTFQVSFAVNANYAPLRTIFATTDLVAGETYGG